MVTRKNVDSCIFGVGSIQHLALARERQAVIKDCLQYGFTEFDVAPSYGNGLNEYELGRACAGLSDIKVNTKFGIPTFNYGPYVRHSFMPFKVVERLTGISRRSYASRVLSPSMMVRSLHESLKRLKRDSVQTLFIHEPISAITGSQMDDLTATANDLKYQGKIEKWGVAGPAHSLNHCATLDHFDVLQCPINGLDALEISNTQELNLYSLYTEYKNGGYDSTQAFRAWVDEIQSKYSAKVILATKSRGVLRELSLFE